MIIRFISFVVLLCCSFSYAEDDFSGNLMIKIKKKGKYYFCSAVAVSPKILLTAAHCLDTANELLVFKEKRSLAIVGFEKHPKYNPSNSLFRFDVGVIELKKNLPLTTKIYSISNTKGDQPIIRVGFGGRNGKNKMTIVKDLKPLDFGNSFIKTKDVRSVSGDSGGALFQKNGEELNLVAIHSTIDGKISFNPSLSLGDPWLKSKIKK